MPELSKEALREWLVEKAPDEVVGVAGASTECPASRWLREMKAPHIHVNYPHKDCAAPLWLRHFVYTLDQHLRIGPWREQRFGDVTAKQALEVLDSLDVS